ncbi:MAG: hypothetical protein CMQ34_15585 [Gammaproteobacteria bacterium]|nr:hypothetical protein [Gammaproteobacteria bacterium]|tara:strand:+ start:775 stop:1203 length:429 start_codon:yes stop_codon:yes gene_type:complete
MNILEHKIAKSSTRHIALIALLLTGALVSMAVSPLVVAQIPHHVSFKIIPSPALIHDVEPEYPARAAAWGIEGWVQVKFTIAPDGTVDPQSIEVVDAQPAQLFDNSAIQAIAQFVFNPRTDEDGVAVAVPNVQHVFRFTLDD